MVNYIYIWLSIYRFVYSISFSLILVRIFYYFALDFGSDFSIKFGYGSKIKCSALCAGSVSSIRCTEKSHHRVDYYTAQHTCMVFSPQPSKPKQSISPTYIHLIYTFLFFLDFEVKISPSFQHFRFSHNNDESSSPTTIKDHPSHAFFFRRKWTIIYSHIF